MTVVRVDATPHSAVFVCQVCGTRDVATARHIALVAAALHVEVAHPDAAGQARILRVRAAATRRP